MADATQQRESLVRVSQVDRGFRISPSCDPSLFSWFRSLCLVFKHRVDDGCVGRFQILSAIPSPPGSHQQTHDIIEHKFKTHIALSLSLSHGAPVAVLRCIVSVLMISNNSLTVLFSVQIRGTRNTWRSSNNLSYVLNHIIFFFSPGAREKKVEYSTYYSSADTYNTTYRLLLLVKPSRPSVTCVLACSWARGLVDLPCWQRGIMVVHFLGPFVRLRHGLFSNQQKTGTRLWRAERPRRRRHKKKEAGKP